MNTTASSDWAKKQAHAILDEFTPLPEWEYDKRHEILVKNLLAAAKVPDGCVTFDEAQQIIRRECGPCQGTGVGDTTYGPDGETPEAVECEYCGRPMDAIKKAAQAALAARGEVNREG